MERLVREQRHITKLKNHELSPRRHVLLVGPPGTGKIFRASILAGMHDFSLFQLPLGSLITKFMGESSAKLRLVFNAISDARGVYFFDELFREIELGHCEVLKSISALHSARNLIIRRGLIKPEIYFSLNRQTPECPDQWIVQTSF